MHWLDLVARVTITLLWLSVAVHMLLASRRARSTASRTLRILIAVTAAGWTVYYGSRLWVGHPPVWSGRLLQGMLVGTFWYHIWLTKVER